MAFITEVADINYRILFLIALKELLRLVLLNRASYQLVTSTLVYRDLVKLRDVVLTYPFTNNVIVEQYYRYGLINVLKQYHYYLENDIELAACYGHVAILDWLINPPFKFTYTYQVIDRAATNGHTAVLEWFRSRGSDFNYSLNAILRCWNGLGHKI